MVLFLLVFEALSIENALKTFRSVQTSVLKMTHILIYSGIFQSMYSTTYPNTHSREFPAPNSACRDEWSERWMAIARNCQERTFLFFLAQMKENIFQILWRLWLRVSFLGCKMMEG